MGTSNDAGLDQWPQAATALSRHPMYQLSTAGQELFHTNLLYWLAMYRPEQSAGVWSALGVDLSLGNSTAAGALDCTKGSTGDPGGLSARREWKHVDLYLDSGLGGPKLVLENKVLAIATAEQLAAYRAALLADPRHKRADPDANLTSWRLLTLLPLTINPPGPWGHVTYADLIDPLRETVKELNAEDAVLIAQYTDLVELLVALCKQVDIVDDLDQRVLLPEAVIESLREARLLALVRKLRTARFASLLTAELQQVDPALPSVNASAGNNGEALSEVFFSSAGSPLQFGWQIQEKSVKLAMRTGLPNGATVADRDALASKHLSHFSFEDVAGADELLVAAGRLAWNGYKHDFVYRYKNLRAEATWRQLLDLAAALTIRVCEYSQAHGAPTGT